MAGRAGREVVEVLNRCERAIENRNLDLSRCGLASIPEAVFHIMKDTVLQTCNISRNDLKKIPVKFSREFAKITELNLSHNQIVSLPTELNQLSELNSAILSHNKLVEFPDGMYGLTNLRRLILCNNDIREVDVDRLCSASSLEEVDLQNNPLTSETWQNLQKVTAFTVKMSPPKDDLEEMD